MTTQAGDTAVRQTITVETGAERAFDVFCHQMQSWWPSDHHILQGELAEMVLEPRVGGRIYDRGTDGSECTWAHVLAYEPSERLVFSWDITPAWQIEDDPDRRSEVEVRFVPEGDARTRVELEHRRLERHGDGWEGVRDAVAAEGGWTAGLQSFARAVA